jgi:hypothetical protein
LSRHRDKVQLFVAREVARDLRQLARQMARFEERRAASQFFHAGEQAGPVCPLTPWELLVRLGEDHLHRKHEREQTRRTYRRAAVEVTEDQNAADRHRRKAKEKRKGKTKHVSGKSSSSESGVSDGDQTQPSIGETSDPMVAKPKASALRALWRQVADWLTKLPLKLPFRPTPRRRDDGPHHDH